VTILFDGNVNIPAGPFTSAPIPVSGTLKKVGKSLALKVSMDEATFPAGATSVSIGVSIDGGANYRTASMTCVNPKTWRGPPPHYWYVSLALDVNATPTHMRYETNAPSAAKIAAIVEAI
jgi:hypothetical protein